MFHRVIRADVLKMPIRFLALMCLFAALTGCSTYGQGVQGILNEVQAENYAEADKVAKETLSPVGSDRLLYFLERGMIAHLDGRYSDSNKLLEQAYRISESLYRTSAEDWLASAMTHPGNAAYQGQIYEKVYLHYIKMLNYLMLAQTAQNRNKLQLLDSARVENRRIQILLDERVFKVGDYGEAKSRQETLFSQFARIFRALNGDPVDPEKLKFRDQAFAHYVMGALYEQYGELDNARISYQRAATLYEEGYSQQYDLDSEMTRLAWADTVRVMRKAGGYEAQWRQLVDDKQLADSGLTLVPDADQAELLILQHVGLSPQRNVLNMHLMINPDSRQLVIRPVPVGSTREQREQAAWFYLLYADKGLYNLVRDFSDGSILNSEGVLFNSRATTLDPVWSLVQESGLDYVLGNGGVRIAVPYYPVPYAPLTSADVQVDDESRPMLKADSVAMLGLLQQVVAAQRDLNGAMARETLRNMATQEVVKDMGALGILGGKLLTASTTNADTRSWLSLPHHIRVQRLQLAPGAHQVVLKSVTDDGRSLQQRYNVTLKAGELKILNLRTFIPSDKPTGE